MGYPQRRHCASRPGSQHSQRRSATSWCRFLRLRAMGLVDPKADDCTLTSLLRRSRCRSTQRCRRHWLVVNHAARPRRHVRATDCCACYGDRLPFGNIGRVIVWWHEIRWRPVFAYSLAGVPAAVLGAHTLLTISPGTVEVFLAAFPSAMIPGCAVSSDDRTST
ncbi:Uncharacterised protein [Raoultella terrigena]|uniref:Uncharacterized protein n=1 Tax=Raoultella terrigena TaxID=577 RepID=A0A4U9CXZ9_RAOTE|nr:Uncharacterised protein [Raoultella terrigena]